MPSLRLVVAGALVAGAAAAPAASAACVPPEKIPTGRPFSVCATPGVVVDDTLVSGRVSVDCRIGLLACAIDPVYVGPTGVGADGGVYVNGNRADVHVADPCSSPLIACP